MTGLAIAVVIGFALVIAVVLTLVPSPLCYLLAVALAALPVMFWFGDRPFHSGYHRGGIFDD